MQKSLEAVFYQCEHTGAFKQGPSAVLEILKTQYGEGCEASVHSLHYFSSIGGYSFIRDGKQSFIPNTKTPPSSTELAVLGASMKAKFPI
jgi:hypothetical protein